MMIRNPILSGFYPDPSICRVGEWFYMVNSTFAYFPGIPVFRSRDLACWEQIGNVLERNSQVSLEGCGHSEGIYAPTIRYYEGVYYVIATNVSGGGNFIVTARQPEGPWSEPYFLGEKAQGIDPSLFFDEDGSCYYIGQRKTPGGAGILETVRSGSRSWTWKEWSLWEKVIRCCTGSKKTRYGRKVPIFIKKTAGIISFTRKEERKETIVSQRHGAGRYLGHMNIVRPIPS